MSGTGLIGAEFRYQLRAFIRDPQAVFFAVGLPLLYVVIFVSLFGNTSLDFAYEGQPGPLKAETIMLANFVSLGLISGTFLYLAINLVQERESGVLKRFRGTPLPNWAFIGGHVGTSVVLGVAVAVGLLLIGRVVYGIPVPLAGLPAVALTLLVASAAFCCMGFAFTLLVRKASAASPLGMGVTLALFFLSGNFFIIEDRPLVLQVIGDIFPVKHLNDALLTPLNPNITGSRVEWLDLLVIAAWGLVALAIALRGFRWTPSAEQERRRPLRPKGSPA